MATNAEDVAGPGPWAPPTHPSPGPLAPAVALLLLRARRYRDMNHDYESLQATRCRGAAVLPTLRLKVRLLVLPPVPVAIYTCFLKSTEF